MLRLTFACFPRKLALSLTLFHKNFLFFCSDNFTAKFGTLWFGEDAAHGWIWVAGYRTITAFLVRLCLETPSRTRSSHDIQENSHGSDHLWTYHDCCFLLIECTPTGNAQGNSCNLRYHFSAVSIEVCKLTNKLDWIWKFLFIYFFLGCWWPVHSMWKTQLISMEQLVWAQVFLVTLKQEVFLSNSEDLNYDNCEWLTIYLIYVVKWNFFTFLSSIWLYRY